MSKYSNISLEEILANIDTLIVTQEDCNYIFKSQKINDEFKRLNYMCMSKQYDVSVIEDFLNDNEDEIDKENLILILAKNCKYQLKAINEKLEKEKNKIATTYEEQKIKLVTINEINKQKSKIEKTLKEVLHVGKGIEKVLTFYRYDKDKKEYKLSVVDSKEIIDNKNVSSVKNTKRFDKIDKSFIKENNEIDDIGIRYILQVINLADFKEVLPNEEFAIDVMRAIYDRKIVEDGKISGEELRYIIENKPEEYTKLIDEMQEEDISSCMRDVLKENIKYVDLDKLLLIASHRFNYGLEGIEDENDTIGYEAIIKVIYDNIENKHAKISCQLEYTLQDKPVLKETEYSTEDLKEFLNGFVNNKYLSKRKRNEYKQKVFDKEIKLCDIPSEYIRIIFSEEDIEKAIKLNDYNLKFAIDELHFEHGKIINLITSNGHCSDELLEELVSSKNISQEDVVQLYLNGIIQFEQLNNKFEDKQQIQFVNSYNMLQYYKNTLKEDSTEEEKLKYQRYIKLYKHLFINNKSEEERELISESIIDLIIKENKQDDKESYLKYLEEYYTNGTITINSILNWSEALLELNNEQIINKLYKDNIISLQEIERLSEEKKIPCECIFNIYKDMINNPDIDYDKRLEYIKTGYVYEEDIFEMYKKNLIFEEDLQELANKGIVRADKVKKLIDTRTKEDLENNSSIKLVGLNNLEKKKSDIYLDNDRREKGTKDDSTEKAPKMIIDPNKRLDYIKLFKAHSADTDLNSDSPFYNYEFYVIPDESEEIGLNSVVIAERYYEDKETEKRFALGNATYFFKYKDLMVLSNFKKSEMTKERKNIVFTANHTLATEDRNGGWAASVIYSIVKTMLSSDLKELSKEQQREVIVDKLNELYSEEEILHILDMGAEIDSGADTYEIVNPEDKIMRKISNIKKTEDREK